MDLSLQKRRRRRNDVNIIPMIDVLTVLIFFFLITMQFKDIHAVDILAPTMQSSEKTKEDIFDVIGISKQGAYYFNGKEIPLAELQNSLNELSKNKTDASLILFADKDVPYRFVAAVIDAVRLAKIKKLSIQSAALEEK